MIHFNNTDNSNNNNNDEESFSLSLDLIQSVIQVDIENRDEEYGSLCQMLDTCFGSVAALNRSFPLNDSYKLSFSRPNIDFNQLKEVYRLIYDLPSERPMKIIVHNSLNLLKRLRTRLEEPTDIQFLLMFLEIPVLYNYSIFTAKCEKVRFGKLQPQLLELLERVVGILAHCCKKSRHYLLNWLSRYETEQFKPKVEILNSYVGHRLTLHYLKGYSDSHRDKKRKSRSSAPRIKPEVYGDDWRIAAFIRVLSIFFNANTVAKTKIPVNTFYNSMVDFTDVSSDFDRWQALGVPSSTLSHYHHNNHNHRDSSHLPLIKSSAFDGFDFSISHQPKVAFCQYPFLLSMGSKTQILEYDAKRQMEYKAQEAFFGALDRLTTPASPYLYLRVNRENILQDSFEAFERHENDLKKGLRIEFINEQGVDAGGLRKEWFLLLIRKLFDPENGYFVVDEESQYCWFDTQSEHALKYYKLSGVAIGLALYNSTILDINFPPVLFKKLLGCAYTLEDFSEFMPTYGKSLQFLLDYEGDDFESVFDMNYTITLPNQEEVSLIHNGNNIQVTKNNRNDYVRKVMNYHLDVLVRRQFEAFKQGFYNVCGGNALTLFRPEEIELLIRGSPEQLDVDGLKSVTKYSNCSSDDVVVKWFWKYMRNLDAEKQRKLLMFVTGSDRIPATGITNMSFKLCVIGSGDTERLPQAHTCFNSLCIYEYSTRAKFEEKLTKAVEMAQGFGIK